MAHASTRSRRRSPAVSELRQKPAGTIRITATENATETILVPKLAPLLREYPDIKVEIIIDYGLTDIVAQQYDAGVRSGEQVAKDMIAVRIGPDMRMAVVGAPSYFKKKPAPKSPQDLIGHNCINLRLPSHGGVYAWEFEKGGRELRVRVEGQFTFNATAQMLNAALAGAGLAYVPESMVQRHLAKGRLKRVLDDWCLPYSGYHLFYPSRRQSSAAFAWWSMRFVTANSSKAAIKSLLPSDQRLLEPYAQWITKSLQIDLERARDLEQPHSKNRFQSVAPDTQPIATSPRWRRAGVRHVLKCGVIG